MKRRRKPPARSPRADKQAKDHKQQAKGDSSGETDSNAVRSGTADSARDVAPSSNLRLLLSAWLVFHFLALAVSYTGVVEPSELQSKVMEVLQIYLAPTHFSADGVELYLARGDQSEQPHRLQVSKVNPGTNPDLFELPMEDDQWMTIPPPGASGMAGNDRYHRWLSMAASLAINEQPSLVAELILPSVIDQDAVRAVRIVRLPTELTTVADDALPPPYMAQVARTGDQVSLVQVNAPRLTTQPREESDE